MRIRCRDLGMNYEERGSGRPLLLIHGYPLNHTLWEPQLDALADQARVIAPDLRGHGQSEPMPGPYSMDLLADDCNALLDALGITQPVVMGGLSMGGYVTFAFYRKYAARVAGLILAATRAGVDSPEAKTNRLKAIELVRDPTQGPSAIAQMMLPRLLAPQTYATRPELVKQVHRILLSVSPEGMIGDLMGMLERPDSTPTLAQIDRPTLIVHGADDPLISPQESQAMHAGIKNSRLVILPGAGHLPNLEQPELFNEAVRDFLRAL